MIRGIRAPHPSGAPCASTIAQDSAIARSSALGMMAAIDTVRVGRLITNKEAGD